VLALLGHAVRIAPRIGWSMIASMLFAALLGTAELVLLGRAIEAVTEAVRDGSTDGTTGPLLALLLTSVVAATAPSVTDWLSTLLQGRVKQDTAVRIAETMTAPDALPAVEDPAVQDLVSRARGANGISLPQSMWLAVRLLNLRLAALGSAVLVAVLLSWWTAAVLVLAAVLAELLLKRAWRVEFGSWPERAEQLRRAEYLFELGMGEGAKELRVFGLAGWLTGGYLRRWNHAMAPVWRARRRTRLAALLALLPLLGALGWVLSEVIDAVGSGELTTGSAASVLPAVLAVGTLYGANLSVLNERGAETLKALRELPEAVHRAAGPPGGTAPAAAPRHSIRFEDVSFRYPGRDTDALHGLHLTLHAGESLALVGVNGAGKSTLVKLLAGVYRPSSGRITVDGTDLADLDPQTWRRHLAAVVQDFVHLPLTAAENIALRPTHPDDRPELDATAEQSAAADLIDALPEGWDTPLDRTRTGGTELSGGQWQRLALARALWATRQGARLLVMDEPAAALDIRAEAELVTRFFELTANTTSLTISHRFSVVRGADRICVLETGRITETGTHQQLLAADGRYAEMFRSQADLYREAATDQNAADQEATADV
jgi:ABC-type multidrug transport system fused ATPase/permease subunit